jgi:hypothetical protein
MTSYGCQGHIDTFYYVRQTGPLKNKREQSVYKAGVLNSSEILLPWAQGALTSARYDSC